MEENDKKIVDEITNKVDTKIKGVETLIEDLKTKSAGKEDLVKVTESITGIETGLKEVREAAVKQGAELAEMKVKSITLVGRFKEELSAGVKQLSEQIEKRELGERIKIKAVGDMSTSNNVTGTGAQPQLLTPISEIRIPGAVAFDGGHNVFQSTEGIITDVSQDSEEGGAARTTEGSAKEQYDFNVYGTQYVILPVNAYITVSRNMMKNLPYLENMIKTRLMKKVYEKASSQVLEGSGVSPIMKGIATFATAWSAGNWANKIVKPCLYDVLIIGIAQARAENFNPSRIYLNPSDAAGLRLAVIANQINAPEAIFSNGQMFVAGVPIVETAQITADTFQLGEYMLSNIALQGGFEIYVDPYTGLTTNKVTILGELFCTHFVAKTDAKAFIYGTVQASINALQLS